MTLRQMFEDVERRVTNEAAPSEDFLDGEKVVPLNVVKDILFEAFDKMRDAHQTRPVEKFMFVEEGSVDTDELEETLELRNPEIKLIVYRQGGARPCIEEVK